MSDFAERTGELLSLPDVTSVRMPGHWCLARASSTGYFDSLALSGSIYTFRPWKLRSFTVENRRFCTSLIILLSAFPVVNGGIGASIILWYSLPTGLNCLHTCVFGIFFSWLISFIITSLYYSRRFFTGKYHWGFVPIKDALIAIPSMTVILMSACGLFSFC